MAQKLKTSLSIFFLFSFAIVLLIIPISPTNLDLSISKNFFPDLLVCFIFAIIINKPELFSPFIVLILCFLSDILLMKPIGLYCALVFITTELIRTYNKIIRKESFLIHFLLFFSCLAVMQGFNITIHKLFFMPSPDLIILTKQCLLTVFFYPLFDLPLKYFLKRRDLNV